MSDANRAAIRIYSPETAFGEYESGNPKFTNLRFTGESLQQQQPTTQSQEINDDRQVSDVIRTGLSYVGTINGEISYGTYDEILRLALLSAGWSTQQQVAAATTISATAGSGSYVIADSANGFGSFVANQWVYVSGFTGGGVANNGFGKMTAAAAGSITISHNGDGATVGAGDEVTVTMASQIVNGVTLDTFNLEKEFADVTQFEQSAGGAIDRWGLNVTDDQLLGITFDVLARISRSAQTTLGDGSPTAAPTGGVFNAIDHVLAVFEGGEPHDITGLTLQYANNLRARTQVARLGAISLGSGTVVPTGNVQAHFSDPTQIDRYLNNEESALALIMGRGADAYVLDMPAVKYTSGGRVAGGINQDVIQDMGFQAKKHAGEGITARIARFPGLIV